MADKLSQLILEALTHAAAEPRGALLYSTRNDPGLFPNTSAAKPAAKRALDERLLQLVVPDAPKNRELATITELGLKHLADHASPKHVIEDFVRILESRQLQVEALLANAQQMQDSLHGMKAALNAVLPQVAATRTSAAPAESWTHQPRFALHHTNGTATATATLAPPKPSLADVAGMILTHLADWSASAGSAHDCPLPDLYRAVACGYPALTLGAFHDAVRRLHDAGQIYLHPWTGPLYAVPEPNFALLAGHNVAYYASSR